MEQRHDVQMAWLGFALVVAGTIAALWAVGNLNGGLAEVPHHWWSTLATIPIILGVATTAAGLVRLSRASARRG
jgi:MFS superfamily sulfate permease-like transporter